MTTRDQRLWGLVRFALVLAASVQLGKMGTIAGSALIGLPFGVSVELIGRGTDATLRRYTLAAMDNAVGEYVPSAANNQTLHDDNTSQALDQDAINELKRTAASGEDIIQRLVDSSATFASKTEFSQAKYLKRKQEKYLRVFTILRPTLRTLSEHFFSKNPDSILDMRMDALAQMMSQGNVRAGARLLVVDDCTGLLVAACLERLGGAGQIIGFQSLPDPSTFYAATLLNLDHAHMQPLHIFSWKRMREDWEQTYSVLQAELAALPEDTDAARRKQLAPRIKKAAANIAVMQSLRAGQFDALLVASRFEPGFITDLLGPLVAPSCPIVVFSAYSEPLAALWMRMRSQNRAVNVSLAETWSREYQVLPGRTHPHMTTSAASGYVLSATTVVDAEAPSRLAASLDRLFGKGGDAVDVGDTASEEGAPSSAAKRVRPSPDDDAGPDEPAAPMDPVQS